VVGLPKDLESVHQTCANSLLPKPLAIFYISAILHHLTQTATPDQQAATIATAVKCSKEEEVSDATTDILPIDEIPESVQEGAVLVQPDSNETPDNIQVEVAEPEVEGGITPREEDPQPDGVASSKDVDFVKAESE